MTKYLEVVGWYDNKARSALIEIEGRKVLPIEHIIDGQKTPVLIAVKDKDVMRDIRSELLILGIEDRLILWSEPIPIG